MFRGRNQFDFCQDTPPCQKTHFFQVGDPGTRAWEYRIPRPMDVSHVCVTTNDVDDGKRCATMSS